jgi:tetratricopeptide (TPR) repeat protein
MEKQYLVIKLLDSGYRARELGTDRIVSIKTQVHWDMERGTWAVTELDTIGVEVSKEWKFGNTKYVSGKITSHRFLTENLAVAPLEFETFPDKECEFKDYTGFGFYGEDSDPVYESTEMDTFKERYDVLTRLWEEFPQCIDALNHLGSLYLRKAKTLWNARNCYEASVFIAEQALRQDDESLFSWEFLNNRPYLRGLHGLCLVYWRMGEFERAERVCRKLLRICPVDNLGARFLLGEIEAKNEWSETV